MFGNKTPKTVSQITQNLQKMIDDLSVSQAQYQERKRQNEERIASLNAENGDIGNELRANSHVAAKLKDILGG